MLQGPTRLAEGAEDRARCSKQLANFNHRAYAVFWRRDLRALLKKLKADQAVADRKQAQMYSRAFQRMAQAPQEKQADVASQVCFKSQEL